MEVRKTTGYRYLVNQHESIWRYMNIMKLISMLKKSELYIPRGDSFTDRFEGSLTRNTLDKIPFRRANELLKAIANDEDNDVLDQETRKSIKESTENVDKMSKERLEKLKYMNFISCWHLSKYESAAMWNIYSKSRGIAIECSLKDVVNYFKKLESSHTMYVTDVTYLDYQNDEMPDVDTFTLDKTFTYKRKSFEHEKELRLIVTNSKFYQNYVRSTKEETKLNMQSNISLEFDLNLIKSIRISPNSPDWYIDNVRDLVQRYDLDPSIVRKTDLEKEPIF